MRNRIEAVLRTALLEAEDKESRARNAIRLLRTEATEKRLNELCEASQELRDAIQWVQQVEDQDGTKQIELIAENARLKRAMNEIQNRRGKSRTKLLGIDTDDEAGGLLVFVDEEPNIP